MYHDDRFNLQAFEEDSTYTNDYRTLAPKFARQIHVYKWTTKSVDDSPDVKPPKVKRMCNESYTKLRDGVEVPFNLLWTPKPIIHAGKVSRKILVKPVDGGKEESIRTRPRVFITPGVSIDDVADKEMRNLLLDYMYTTEFRRGEKNVDRVRGLNKKDMNVCCCEVPNEKETGEYEYMVQDRKNMRVESPDQKMNISPYMREKYDKWDAHQKRGVVSRNEYFWSSTDIPRNIDVKDGLITPEMKENIRELIRIDRLRMPYDPPMPSYAGHVVQLPAGVPLRKRDFPVGHPMMTTQACLHCRYDEDTLESKQ